MNSVHPLVTLVITLGLTEDDLINAVKEALLKGIKAGRTTNRAPNLEELTDVQPASPDLMEELGMMDWKGWMLSWVWPSGPINYLLVAQPYKSRDVSKIALKLRPLDSAKEGVRGVRISTARAVPEEVPGNLPPLRKERSLRHEFPSDGTLKKRRTLKPPNEP